jgi:hypothetical protein
MTVIQPESTADLLAAFDELVAQGDLELTSFSLEQYAALFADVHLLAQATEPLVMEAALRTLVAAGLAEMNERGELALTGDAALIRAARNLQRHTLTYWLGEPRPETGVVWSTCGPGSLLQQSLTRPGVFDFALRDRRGAVAELVRTAVPNGSTDSEAAPLEREIADLDRPQGARVTTLKAIVMNEDGPGFVDMLMISNTEQCSLALTVTTPGQELRRSLSSVSRRTLRSLIADVLSGNYPQL